MPVKLFAVILSCLSIQASAEAADAEQRARIDGYIRMLVPSDGRSNGVGHSQLVNIGQDAVQPIIENVFRNPKGFFDLRGDSWQFSASCIQVNGARVLAEIKPVGVRNVLVRARSKMREPRLIAEMDEIIRSLDKDRGNDPLGPVEAPRVESD